MTLPRSSFIVGYGPRGLPPYDYSLKNVARTTPVSAILEDINVWLAQLNVNIDSTQLQLAMPSIPDDFETSLRRSGQGTARRGRHTAGAVAGAAAAEATAAVIIFFRSTSCRSRALRPQSRPPVLAPYRSCTRPDLRRAERKRCSRRRKRRSRRTGGRSGCWTSTRRRTSQGRRSGLHTRQLARGTKPFPVTKPLPGEGWRSREGAVRTRVENDV